MRAAWAAAITNAIAAAAMALVLSPGLVGDGRADWIATHRLAWTLGWLAWPVAAIALVNLYVALAGSSRLPLLVAAAGLAADLSAETILIIVLPELRGDRFLLVEKICGALTGFLGNGLYTVAGILLTIEHARTWPRGLVGLAAAVWAAGLLLSGAVLVQSQTATMVATAALMPLFVLWAAGMARWLGRS